MKKSLFTLFTSLIVCGLLLVWSTEAAFKYKAYWDSMIAFEKDNFQSWVKSIKYWSHIKTLNFTEDHSWCNEVDYWIECYLEWESWEYEVTVEFYNTSYPIVYLRKQWNVIKINEYDSSVTIDYLHLSNNTGIDLNGIAPTKIRNIYVNNSNLSTFNIWLNSSGNPYNIYFENNQLQSMPEEIRCNRYNYNIALTNATYKNDYSSSARNISLKNNPIKFVWITEVGSESTSSSYSSENKWTNIFDCDDNSNTTYNFSTRWNYYFERTWYEEGNSNRNYNYEILKDEITVPGTYSGGSSTSVDFNNNLEPWDYVFKVCINWNTTCDSVNFTVPWYNLWIGLTWTTSINSQNDNIYFEWNQVNSADYQNSYNFQYKVTPENDSENIIYEWTTNQYDRSFNVEYDRNKLNNGSSYKFTVFLVDNNWNKIEADWTNIIYYSGCHMNRQSYWNCSEYPEYSGPIYASRTFTVNIPEGEDPKITINRPSDPETEAITYFSWTPSIDHDYFDFNNYYWSISWVDNSTLLTGLIWDINNTWFSTGNLNNGSYTFNVMLNYTKKSSREDGVAIDDTYSANGGAKPFTINKPSSLSILSPAEWATLTLAENTFSRTWDTANTFIKYSYTVTWNNYLYTWETTNQNSTSFSIRNLEDWAYTFTVIMHTDAGTKTDSRNFSVSATSWAYINITSPGNWKTYTWNRIKLVPTDFTWVWTGSSRIDRFTYKLTNTITNSEITWWTINKNSNWNYSIQQISLPSGKYSFEVKMLDSNGTTIKDKTHNFTISIPSHLTISTPPAWQLSSKDVTFSRTWFAEFQDHYKYKLDRVNDQWNIISTITWNENTSITSFSMTNIHNGKYTFTVSIMNSSNSEIKTESRTFWIPDDQDLILDISDWTTSTKNIKTGTWIFSRWWKSEDFYWYYYSISGTNFKNEPFIHTWKTSWEVTWNIILTNLTSWKYRFSVNMLDENDSIITWKYLDFSVAIPASLKITNPSNWSTITSSSTTLSRMGKWDIFRTWYSTDSRHYEYELLQVTTSWQEQKAASPKTNANSFSYSSFQDGASYQLKVKLYSGNTLLASDTSSFSVSIPKHSSGWWGWSSSKSHPTNDLSVSVTNDEPTTNERIEVVVDINDKYTWKVDFTKMQYYSFDEEKRIDIPVTSKNYVSDYSDDAKLGYVKFDSSDDGEKNLSEFLMFSQPGNYRIHVEDKDWYKEYTEFYVWKWNKAQVTKTSDDEYYIARSCKKYKIEYLNNLGVYTSPNLKQDEYFVSKDYFKRYIDSKNRRADWCPTNIWWITTTYKDSSNSSDRYTAPNGKVYFINWKNWSYSSTELDKELNGSKKFWSVTDLKYFIRDRNPFISMAKLWPTK